MKQNIQNHLIGQFIIHLTSILLKKCKFTKKSIFKKNFFFHNQTFISGLSTKWTGILSKNILPLSCSAIQRMYKVVYKWFFVIFVNHMYSLFAVRDVIDFSEYCRLSCLEFSYGLENVSFYRIIHDFFWYLILEFSFIIKN